MSFLSRLFNTSTYKRDLQTSFVENSFFKNHSIPLYTAQGINEMYEKNIILRAIIEKSAEIFSRFEYSVLDNKGLPIQNSKVLQPFLYPLIQNSEQFIKLFLIQYLLYDTVILLHKDSILGVFNENSKLNILDYSKVQIFWKVQSLQKFTDPKENIQYIQYYYNNQIFTFYPSEFEIISKYELTQNQVFTLSSANEDLNIIYKALCIRNKYNSNTQLGMLSPKDNNKEEPARPTISDNEKTLQQKELRQYSSFNGEYNIMVQKRPMEYTDLMPTIEKMILEPSTQASILRVCSLLNFPSSSLNTLSDSKFSNKEFGNKDIYTDLIIPAWNLYEMVINKLYNFKYNIALDYSFIEALQPDKKTQYEISNLQADAIIKLNTEIKNGNLTNEIAINILINTYGFDTDNAKLYLIKDITNATV